MGISPRIYGVQSSTECIIMGTQKVGRYKWLYWK